MPIYASFGYTGAEQLWVVEAGVSVVRVACVAGSGSPYTGLLSGITPGLGGSMICDLAVTPGETLYVYVGGEGVSHDGGFNGGGSSSIGQSGVGGGGASDVRQGGNTLADRVVIAGGGGGWGRSVFSPESGASDGGHGSGGLAATAGEDGLRAVGSPPPGGGQPGTTSGGAAGTPPEGVNEAGALGLGGDVLSAPSGGAGRAGCGGGGWYGGGCGAGATNAVAHVGGGGGGGSGLGTGVNETATTGTHAGDGAVIFEAVPVFGSMTHRIYG